MSVVLGLNSGHDGSACIIKDGKILSAVGTERVTRIKKASGYTDSVIDYVLDAADIKWEDIDHIVHVDHDKSIWGNDIVPRALKYPIYGKEITAPLISHHTAHAAASYYTSQFDTAWVFTLDSSWGDARANSSICFGHGNKLDWIECPLGHDPYIKEEFVGCMYSAATLKLGLGSPLYKAGTTMGLACYGKTPPKEFDWFGQFRADEIQDDQPDGLWAEDFQDKADLALACQNKFEETVLGVLSKLDQTKSKNLCLGGGSMLNCTLNGKIVKQSTFEDYQIFPACGDDGLAVGAALYYAHHILDEPRHHHSWAEQCYTGKDYPKVEPDYKAIAQQIADGNIIGWFNGRSEFGPRALGNRSILADPRTYHSRELINHYIKNREWFRPFAPVVLEEEADKWFDWQIPSPFMLYTAQVRRPGEIQAITHVDNSARLQTINEETNPHYYKLVKAFYELTGVPVLLNTSLNDNGQPIVETPEQALEFLQKGKLNFMVINGIMCKSK